MVLAIAPGTALQAASHQEAAAAAVWLDASGNPLPFQDAATILQVLQEAEIIDSERTEVGITGPRRLLLEHDGTRFQAAFRTFDETHSRVRLPDGSYFQRLRDYYGFELAAYRISLLLAMDSVPPTTLRTVNRDRGTVQIWCEGTMMESERAEKNLKAPNSIAWRRQLQEMYVFDDLIGNIDRNLGNLLIDGNWKLWLIDHSRAFQQGDEIKNASRVLWVRTAFWEALKALDIEALEAAADGEVDSRGLREMMERRDLLVTHIQGLIDQRGAEAVLYD